MIRAIAFDLDGTLVDSVTDLAAAANVAREALGLAPLPPERVKSFVGDGVAVLVKRAITDDPTGEPSAESLEQALASFHAHYGEHLADHTRPYPGVIDGLQQFQAQGLPLAIVTNKPEHHTHKLLQHLGLAGFFRVVMGGDSLPTRKPAPEPLLAVAERLAVEPAELLMVGDSENDVLCARAAGCPVVVMRYGYAGAGVLPADREADRLADVLA